MPEDVGSCCLAHTCLAQSHANGVAHVVRPALEAGMWVVSDRFADSTMAYQGYGHRLGRTTIAALYRLTIGEFRPDLTLILDVPVDTGLRRAANAVSLVLVMVFLTVPLVFGLTLVTEGFQVPSPSMQIPMGWAYLSVLVGTSLMFVQAIVLLVRTLAGVEVADAVPAEEGAQW